MANNGELQNAARAYLDALTADGRLAQYELNAARVRLRHAYRQATGEDLWRAGCKRAAREIVEASDD